MNDACEGVMAILAIAFWIGVFYLLWKLVLRPLLLFVGWATVKVVEALETGWKRLAEWHKKNVEKYSG